VKKAVILAGGAGTRLSPATLVTNKHLLPIYSDQGAIPMLSYPINTLVKSGVTNILIVSSKEHCGHIIENMGDGYKFGANFTYKIQDTNRVPMGIASALKLAEDFTEDSNFAVLLGDNFFEDEFSDEFSKFDASNTSGAEIFVKEVSDPKRFGVYHDGSIVEKPENPKSNLAVTGIYLYTKHVYEVAKELKLSQRKELEVTDINNYYCKNNRIKINHISGYWSDMGTPSSVLQTQRFIEKNNYKL
jgi:glucose-1-phosphate thymidylyltransferase